MLFLQLLILSLSPLAQAQEGFRCYAPMFLVNRGNVIIDLYKTQPDGRLIGSMQDQFSKALLETNSHLQVRELPVRPQALSADSASGLNEAENIVRQAQYRLDSVLFKGSLRIRFPLSAVARAKLYDIRVPAWKNWFSGILVLELSDSYGEMLGRLLYLDSHINECIPLSR